jgi:hypothetical protein
MLDKTTRAHADSHADAPGHARTQTEICNTYCCFFTVSGFANAPRCYVIRALPLLFVLTKDTMKINMFWNVTPCSLVQKFTDDSEHRSASNYCNGRIRRLNYRKFLPEYTVSRTTTRLSSLLLSCSFTGMQGVIRYVIWNSDIWHCTMKQFPAF